MHALRGDDDRPGRPRASALEPLRTLSTYRRDDRLAGVTFGMNAIVVEGAVLRDRRGARVAVDYRF